MQAAMDAQSLSRGGRGDFDKGEFLPFEEMSDALSPDNKAWRFPWVVIAARKAT